MNDQNCFAEKYSEFMMTKKEKIAVVELNQSSAPTHKHPAPPTPRRDSVQLFRATSFSNGGKVEKIKSIPSAG